MIRSRFARCIAALMLFPAVAAAQSPTAPLADRLDAATRADVGVILAQARRDSLPVEPLVNKALEGAGKGAPGARVTAAVRALASHLGSARDALGPRSTQQEIVAGAEAVRAGIPADRLRGLRADAGAHSLVVPLTTLADLVGRGVPADVALGVVSKLVRRAAPDQAYAAAQRDAGRGIGHRAVPASPGDAPPRGGPPSGVPASKRRPQSPSSRP